MTTDRAAYTSGLRKFADLLDEHPEIELPLDGSDCAPITTYYLGDDAKERVSAFVRAVPGRVNKRYDDAHFHAEATLDGLHVRALAYRNAVCERIVTGTREVTEEVPDPKALAAVPTTTVTRTVEDVEWVCAPLLAEAVSA
jgi:hypothetical protein